jgi:multicomponent Na+:H+ antiporter subunit D
MIAPTPVSALLHAVAVVKVGIFTILKVIIYIFGIHFISKWGGMLICICAAITILISSIICLKQDNLKRLLAYSTISQLSYCLLAASIMTPKAIIAAVLHMISHAVAKIVLFFSAGCFYTATYKTSIKETAGLGKEMPIVGLCFTICALSILGVPPLIGFFSKLYILSAAHSLDNVSLIVIVVILISTVLNAAYFIPVIYNLWWEKKLDHEELVVHKEIPFSMILPIIMITLIASLLFLFGNRLIKFIEMII